MAALALPWALAGQSNSILTVAQPQKISAKRNLTLETKLAVQVRPGYHVNSNTPAEDYLIPLRLQWDAAPLKAVEVVYPKPEMQKYDFSEKPISVYSGGFDLVTRFKVDPKAPVGLGVMVGKLRYQACNQNACFPPRTVEVRVPYDIH